MASVTVAQADTYFATRLGASTYWTSGAAKAAALQTAENLLSARYSLSATADTAQIRAVCEQALFLLANPDWEQRAALRAQGVASAGVVKESYLAGAEVLPIAPLAAAALTGRESGGITSVDLYRDGDQEAEDWRDRRETPDV